MFNLLIIVGYGSCRIRQDPRCGNGCFRGTPAPAPAPENMCVFNIKFAPYCSVNEKCKKMSKIL